jgi:hypothetical protein
VVVQHLECKTVQPDMLSTTYANSVLVGPTHDEMVSVVDSIWVQRCSPHRKRIFNAVLGVSCLTLKLAPYTDGTPERVSDN